MTFKGPALLFPGQGAHNQAMLDGVRQHPSFKYRYELVCDALTLDPLNSFDTGSNPDLINENAVSSLLTVLASVIAYDEWLALNPEPLAVAGYSIGQWTALYAAGVLSFETLIAVARQRAAFMDECFKTNPGAMMAVIGVAPAVLSEFCAGLRADNLDIVISNFNCYGQYSLAGTREAIETALLRISDLKPKKAIKLPTSGAWHCHLLSAAADKFAAYLRREVEFRAAKIPVADNVTGEFLPQLNAKTDSPDSLIEALSKHVNNPVQWEAGVKTLIAFGCNPLVEVGYGNTLTKFGFFVDRSVEHRAFYPSLVVA